MVVVVDCHCHWRWIATKPAARRPHSPWQHSRDSVLPIGCVGKFVEILHRIDTWCFAVDPDRRRSSSRLVGCLLVAHHHLQNGGRVLEQRTGGGGQPTGSVVEKCFPIQIGLRPHTGQWDYIPNLHLHHSNQIGVQFNEIQNRHSVASVRWLTSRTGRSHHWPQWVLFMMLATGSSYHSWIGEQYIVAQATVHATRTAIVASVASAGQTAASVEYTETRICWWAGWQIHCLTLASHTSERWCWTRGGRVRSQQTRIEVQFLGFYRKGPRLHRKTGSESKLTIQFTWVKRRRPSTFLLIRLLPSQRHLYGISIGKYW